MPETPPLATVKAKSLRSSIASSASRIAGSSRNGQPAAVLLSTDDLESLEETLAVMSDR